MKKDRKKVIIKTSGINIFSNVILSSSKMFLGIISNSISILSDGINNLTDTLSSIITIIGTKLANKEPDKEHPYGHGRVEYITSLIVAAIVLYAGISALIASVSNIIKPVEPTITYLSLSIILVSIIVKYSLSRYIKSRGKEVNSQTLLTCATDAFNDVLLTLSVLLGNITFLLFKLNIEAYIGIFISIYIIKAGIDFIRESINNVLGFRVSSELSTAIKRDVAKEENVEGAYDLHLTNYGPDNYIGSIHIEVLDTLTVAEVDKISRNISKNIYDKYGVLLHTIGVYSVNTKNKKFNEAKDRIKEIVFSNKGVLQTHGVYINQNDKTIYLDVVVDFNVKERDKIYKRIYKELQKEFKDYSINITIDFDIND